MLWHAVELDNGTMSGRRLGEKFQSYAQWSKSVEGTEHLLRLYRCYKAIQLTPHFDYSSWHATVIDPGEMSSDRWNWLKKQCTCQQECVIECG